MTRWASVLALLPVLTLGACSAAASGPVVTSTAALPSAVPFATATPSSADALVGWPGAAAQAVRCTGPVIGTTRAAPYEGEDVGTTPEAALTAARKWGSWDGAQEGYTLTGSTGDRRLYVFAVAGTGKQALILRRGPVLKGDGTRATVIRWWLESYARCDYAELPDSAIADTGTRIWTDTAGRRQLTSTIMSFEFRGDCFPGMTALDIDGPAVGGWNREKRQATEYVRAPAHELQDEYFDRAYAEHMTVPADATDSGFERAGGHLWFSRDRGLAYVGAQDDAEAWPRARQPIRCA